MKGKLHNVVTNLRSQLLQYCTGQGDYYYDLRDEQVKTEFLLHTEVKSQFPVVCVAGASEDLIPETLNTPQTIGGNPVSVAVYLPQFEIDLFGYVKSDSSEKAMPECLKLLSDVENAILTDDTLGSSVAGLTLRSSTGNYDRFGVFHLNLSGTYSGR